MTQEEILEYNKRCAEFLGLTELKKPYVGAFAINGGTNIPDSFLQLVYSEMEGESWYVYPKFHSDWNWIHEVVEAIENLNRKDLLHYNEIKIFRNHIDVSYNMSTIKRYTFSDDYSEQSLSQGRLAKIKHFKTKKEATVQAINQFLIWYNKNK